MVENGFKSVFAYLEPLWTCLTSVFWPCLRMARKQKRANANTYRKLPAPYQQLVNIIQKTEKWATSTIDKLQRTYLEVTTKPIDAEQLEQKLAELEKIGVIKSHIANKHDGPIQTWKTQI